MESLQDCTSLDGTNIWLHNPEQTGWQSICCNPPTLFHYHEIFTAPWSNCISAAPALWGVSHSESHLHMKNWGKQATINSVIHFKRFFLTLKVLVATIDAQWEGMGDVGSARYEPALLPPCPTIRVLSYSNCQRSTHSISKWIFGNLAL